MAIEGAEIGVPRGGTGVENHPELPKPDMPAHVPDQRYGQSRERRLGPRYQRDQKPALCRPVQEDELLEPHVSIAERVVALLEAELTGPPRHRVLVDAQRRDAPTERAKSLRRAG